MLLISKVARLMDGGLLRRWSSSSQLRSIYSFKSSISESMSDENWSITSLYSLTLIPWSLPSHSWLMRDGSDSITGAISSISWTSGFPAIDKSLDVPRAFFTVCMSCLAVATMSLIRLFAVLKCDQCWPSWLNQFQNAVKLCLPIVLHPQEMLLASSSQPVQLLSSFQSFRNYSSHCHLPLVVSYQLSQDPFRSGTNQLTGFLASPLGL